MVPAERKPLNGSDEAAPRSYRTEPADGKYAWVILFACFLSKVVIASPLTAFSVVIFDLMNKYDVNTATVSWLPSIHVSIGKFLGPLHVMILNTYGCRKSALLGSSVLSIGFIASSFVNDIGILCFTFGILTGFGTGLCVTTYFIILSQYFKKYYGLAVGISMASVPLSRLMLIPLTQYLQQEYGLRGVFLILGALSLHSCVGAALFQPAKWHNVLLAINDDDDAKYKSQPATKREFPKIYLSGAISRNTAHCTASERTMKNQERNLVGASEMDTENDLRRQSLARYSQSLASTWDVYESNISINCKSSNTKESSYLSKSDNEVPREMDGSNKDCAGRCCCKFITSKIDLCLLKEPLFYMLCVNGFLVRSIVAYSGVFLFPLGIEKGITPLELTLIISVKSIAEIVSRIAIPVLVLLMKLSNRYTYIGLGTAHGIFMLVVGSARTFPLFLAWAIAIGILSGGCVNLSTVLSTTTMGSERLSSVIGLSNFIQGIFLLPMAPAMGWLRDQSGSFANIYTVLALQQFLLVALWIAKPMIPSAKKA